jgi:hypothetical protein
VLMRVLAPCSPSRVWIRFEPHCHVPEIVRIVPHIAFAVDDLDEALKGREILPNQKNKNN